MDQQQLQRRQELHEEKKLAKKLAEEQQQRQLDEQDITSFVEAASRSTPKTSRGRPAEHASRAAKSRKVEADGGATAAAAQGRSASADQDSVLEISVSLFY
jgi:hypothetical protein